MLTTMMALLLAGSGKPGNDWLVIGQLFTDAFCMTAHDRVSGAILKYCSAVRDPEGTASALRSSSRLTATHEYSFGRVSVQQFEFSDPGANARRLREDVGPTPGCDVDDWVAAVTPSPECTQEVVFLSRAPGRKVRRYDLISCSTQQTERALAYVHDVSLGRGPKVIEQGPRSHGRAIAAGDIGPLAGMSSADVLRRHGLPEWVRPRYPDGFRWVFPRDTRNPAVVVEFDRERLVRNARVPCD
jgi:hypothetical protein